MKNSGKATIMLLIVVIIISLIAAGGVFYLLQKEKIKNVALQDQLEDVVAKQKITETKLDDAKKTVASLEFKLQEAGAEIEKTKAELAAEKSAKEDALGRADQLSTELDQQKTLKADLEVKLTQAQKDIDDTKAQLSDLSSKKGDLEKKIVDLEAQVKAAQEVKNVELGKVVVMSEPAIPDVLLTDTKKGKAKTTAKAKTVAKASTKTAPTKTATVAKVVPAAPGLSEGKILVVNKEYNFAVVNLGSKDGVVMGDIFSVYHDNKFVGDVKIEKLHDSMAAAGFSSPDLKSKIIEGDKAVRKAK